MRERQFDSVVESKKTLEEMLEAFGNVSDDRIERLEIVGEELLKFLNASELYSKNKHSLRYWFGWEVDEVYEFGRALYKFNEEGVLVRRDKFADVYFTTTYQSSLYLEELKKGAVPRKRKSYIIRHAALGTHNNNYICMNKETTDNLDIKPYLGNIRNKNMVKCASINEAREFLKTYNLVPEDQYQILEEVKDSRYGRVKDYIIGDLDDAKAILSKLNKRAVTHGVATIADYYTMVGIETEFEDYNYGWVEKDILRMEIKGSNGGWYIDFPKIRSVR